MADFWDDEDLIDDPWRNEGVWNPNAPNLDPSTGKYSDGSVPGGDPQAEQQARLAQFRAEAAAKGHRIDESDAVALQQMQRFGWQPGQSLPVNTTDRPSTGGGGGSFSFAAPSAISPFASTFKAPTMDEVSNSAGFKFRLENGIKALERRASAGGILGNPGTWQGISNWASDYASDEYDQEYDRRMGEHLTARDTHYGNEDRRYSSERTNRGDSFNFADTNRRFDRGVYEGDRAWGRGIYESDRNFDYTKGRDRVNDMFRYTDYGYNSARR